MLLYYCKMAKITLYSQIFDRAIMLKCHYLENKLVCNSICNLAITMWCRVSLYHKGDNYYRLLYTYTEPLANDPGDRASIPGQVIPKTQKIVLDVALVSTQHYKVRIKGKVEQSWEWSSTLSYTLV